MPLNSYSAQKLAGWWTPGQAIELFHKGIEYHEYFALVLPAYFFFHSFLNFSPMNSYFLFSSLNIWPLHHLPLGVFILIWMCNSWGVLCSSFLYLPVPDVLVSPKYTIELWGFLWSPNFYVFAGLPPSTASQFKYSQLSLTQFLLFIATVDSAWSHI